MLQLEHICAISRDTAIGTNGRTEKSSVYTDVPCLVLPMNTSTAIQNKFEIGRAYDIYFADGQDVKPGDQLTYSGSSFMVKVVQPYAVAYAAHVRTMCQQEIA